ncbi:DNA-binding pseudobarrel domain-containing protein [Dioscorea alata]|uniref:DNA-binding pseudobarrel domain-containing protein n=1 Tax=Dioscorea alata TaxID=55571 RepID=A0ACB7UD44_DIOAL|nr:DNA-binding pseudobarrel domain-containing protein [Dioscorea alata]
MDTPEVVQRVMDYIGGKQPTLFAQKIFTASDVNRQQNRLLIPQEDVNNLILPQLSEVERANLLAGLALKLYTSPGWDFTILLSCRHTGGLVLRGSQWTMLLNNANIQLGDRVQIWSFRNAYDNELCLVIAKNNAA